MNPGERAFQEYHLRSDLLDGPAEAKQRWFDTLAVSAYLPHLPPPGPCRLLEIGCGRGYLLHALQKSGYRNLAGLDLSAAELEKARARTGLADLFCEDAVAFLEKQVTTFDAVVCKAVIEHVPRDRIGLFLGAVAGCLAPSGVVLCEVPNMDWYAAGHERYMDITHETGYTRESLAQLFGLYFESVTIRKVLDPAHGALARPWRRLARKGCVALARRALAILGEDGAEFWFDCRSILAAARRPRADLEPGSGSPRPRPVS